MGRPNPVARAWRRLWWTSCGMCEVEFRKGRGGGMSRSVVCSEDCWADAWREWMRPRRRVAATAEEA